MMGLLEWLCLAAGLLFWPQGTLAWLFIKDGQFLLAGLSLVTTIRPYRVRMVERVLLREIGSAAPMTRGDAYACLGCHPSASRDAIARAYRAKMRRVHPDAGGSQYLAARVNEAKTILLGRSS